MFVFISSFWQKWALQAVQYLKAIIVQPCVFSQVSDEPESSVEDFDCDEYEDLNEDEDEEEYEDTLLSGWV